MINCKPCTEDELMESSRFELRKEFVCMFYDCYLAWYETRIIYVYLHTRYDGYMRAYLNPIHSPQHVNRITIFLLLIPYHCEKKKLSVSTMLLSDTRLGLIVSKLCHTARVPIITAQYNVQYMKHVATSTTEWWPGRTWWNDWCSPLDNYCVIKRIGWPLPGQ